MPNLVLEGYWTTYENRGSNTAQLQQPMATKPQSGDLKLQQQIKEESQ